MNEAIIVHMEDMWSDREESLADYLSEMLSEQTRTD